jgi:hypothetical protein
MIERDGDLIIAQEQPGNGIFVVNWKSNYAQPKDRALR